jgi:hypothetical protein
MAWLIALVLALGPATAGGQSPASPAEALESARAELARRAREYRASLERLLALQDEAVARAQATARSVRALLESGAVSRREVEESERAAGAARAAADATRAAIAEADHLIAEAEAVRQIAALPPPESGEVRVLPALIRYAGTSGWSPAMTPRLQHFYRERFGRPLPLSAVGQTPLHDRLGFDHRNAIDVAVHPDTPEGQAVMAWLREQGVSFLAFRSWLPGESTGAHVHVGEPSPRLAVSPR